MKQTIFLAFLIGLLFVGVIYGNLAELDAQHMEEITVYAAASLTESFNEIKEVYESNNPNVKINLNFAGSQTLKISLENGGKADVFVSANLKYMDELKNKGFINNYRVLLQNRLVLVRNISSPFSAKNLSDLSKDGIRIAVGDKTVPVGSYWEQALDISVEEGEIPLYIKERIDKNIKTRELNVKDVLRKVLLGEVDFGVVYKSDVTTGNEDKLEEIELNTFSECDVEYPVAILNNAEGRAEVKKFYNFLITQECKDILKKYRFDVD
ncbi:MAG: Molybdate-binding periplasmic protein precursor [Firmicutes bacterium ADurb.Bin419]|nr:MAG: Molybdate-binding periplasmic protein precursor [Firmicutes bacterium ADurb.Bin419]